MQWLRVAEVLISSALTLGACGGLDGWIHYPQHRADVPVVELPQVYLPWRLVTTPKLYQVPIHCWVDMVLGLRKSSIDFSLRPGFEPGPSQL